MVCNREQREGSNRQVFVCGEHLLLDATILIGEGWTQLADARDADGLPVKHWSDEATSWSLVGALSASLDRLEGFDRDAAADELAAARGALGDVLQADLLEAWNDAPERTQIEVLGALRAARVRTTAIAVATISA
jgi:hypothetical protein